MVCILNRPARFRAAGLRKGRDAKIANNYDVFSLIKYLPQELKIILNAKLCEMGNNILLIHTFMLNLRQNVKSGCFHTHFLSF